MRLEGSSTLADADVADAAAPDAPDAAADAADAAAPADDDGMLCHCCSCAADCQPT